MFATILNLFFFFSSRRRHTRSLCDWSSDVCSSDLLLHLQQELGVALGALHPVQEHLKRLLRLQRVEHPAELPDDLQLLRRQRSEERRVGKECRSRWSREL